MRALVIEVVAGAVASVAAYLIAAGLISTEVGVGVGLIVVAATLAYLAQNVAALDDVDTEPVVSSDERDTEYRWGLSEAMAGADAKARRALMRTGG